VTPATDLASRWLGGSVVAASDESFGEKENLLNPAPAAFEPGHYGHRGEIVDGWETRRRREPGHDWAIVRLGAPGVITSIDIDTSFFTGNFPQAASVEAGGWEGYPSPEELAGATTGWEPVVPLSKLTGDGHNVFTVTDARRFTHVRVCAHPDGGIARLRVPGRVVPDPRELDGLTIDLASQRHGGIVVESSDDFYTSASHLNRPDQARTMGEGWETQRRRGPGNDYVIFRLAFPGVVRSVVIDTAHFKYNASAAVTLRGCAAGPDPAGPDPAGPVPAGDSPGWLPLLGRTRLQPDTRHVFASQCTEPVGAVRLDAFPDGGLSRVRLIGTVTPGARRAAGYLWFNSLPVPQAIRCLTGAGIQAELAAEITRERPLRQGQADGPHPAGPEREAAAGVLTALLDGPAH
jgi:allantoicase